MEHIREVLVVILPTPCHLWGRTLGKNPEELRHLSGAKNEYYTGRRAVAREIELGDVVCCQSGRVKVLTKQG